MRALWTQTRSGIIGADDGARDVDRRLLGMPSKCSQSNHASAPFGYLKEAKGTRHQRRCYEAVTKVVNKLRDRPELLVGEVRLPSTSTCRARAACG